MLGLSIFWLNSLGIFKSSVMEIREIAIFFTTNFINWTKILEKICFCCQSYHSLDLSTPMHSVWFSHISLCYHTTRHFFPNIMQILYSSLCLSILTQFNFTEHMAHINTKFWVKNYGMNSPFTLRKGHLLQNSNFFPSGWGFTLILFSCKLITKCWHAQPCR